MLCSLRRLPEGNGKMKGNEQDEGKSFILFYFNEQDEGKCFQ